MAKLSDELVFITDDKLDAPDRFLIARLQLALHLEVGLSTWHVLHNKESEWFIGTDKVPSVDWRQILKLIRLGYMAEVDTSRTNIWHLNVDFGTLVFGLTDSGHALGRAILATRPVKGSLSEES